ncbi:hypothetical protein DFP95_11422 [Cohnella lupini]|uniref:Uncharacterized protein n=1 Tax=Cohnella lupini TaxID=1294267 RepID=A0A3D9I3V3_9BACL|nr:hypothetical protein DFP95_11422 [Cohnella lupini]
MRAIRGDHDGGKKWYAGRIEEKVKVLTNKHWEHLRKKPYLLDAIAGNSAVLVSSK